LGSFVGHNRSVFTIERIVDKEVSFDRKDQRKKENGEDDGAWFHKISCKRGGMAIVKGAVRVCDEKGWDIVPLISLFFSYLISAFRAAAEEFELVIEA